MWLPTLSLTRQDVVKMDGLREVVGKETIAILLEATSKLPT